MNALVAGLEWQAGEGTLAWNGIRYMLIRPETIVALQRGVEERLGTAAAAALLFDAGRAGGSRSASTVGERFGLDGPGTAGYMARMGAELGWAGFQVAGLDLAARTLVVEAAGSAFAWGYRQLYGQSAGPVCHFARGVFAGVAEILFDTPAVESAEESCLAAGAPVCRFRFRAP